MVSRIAFSVDEAAESLGVSANTVWNLIRDGALRRVKVGRRTLIPVTSLEALVAPEPETHRGQDDAKVVISLGHAENSRVESAQHSL